MQPPLQYCDPGSAVLAGGMMLDIQRCAAIRALKRANFSRKHLQLRFRELAGKAFLQQKRRKCGESAVPVRATVVGETAVLAEVGAVNQAIGAARTLQVLMSNRVPGFGSEVNELKQRLRRRRRQLRAFELIEPDPTTIDAEIQLNLTTRTSRQQDALHRPATRRAAQGRAHRLRQVQRRGLDRMGTGHTLA